ncbi:ferredoxin [Streptomyces cavernae]|uniref:ferredoxin n=1 Tax=Streptomyces cavernae TaxID=2259034 RepID=UPI000FEBFCFB|nr:ferredoxin [Streptomyces cavernae]
MTSAANQNQTTDQQVLIRFLEDRFACAQACSECARVCALRASHADPDGPPDQERLRRKAILCTEVCDATCRLLSEESRQDETGIRLQVEWCRTMCLECAQACDGYVDAADCAAACRACARACTDFLATLN